MIHQPELVIARLLALASAEAPGVVGMTGSVAVGKTTFASEIASRLRAGGTAVEVVSTDGFLFSNQRLGELGLGMRKGFPESFDREALAGFLKAAHGPTLGLTVPMYDHFRYDVLDETRVLGAADLVIVEGLCLLGPGAAADGVPIADRLDMSIYLDADHTDIEGWFTERFVTNAARADDEPGGFWDLFAALAPEQVRDMAAFTWREINAQNLAEHIEPGRAEADVVFHFRSDHTVGEVTFQR